MKLFGLGNLHIKSKLPFDKISGYEDIKDIVRRALGTENSYNLLLCGPPASSKTLFLLGILDIRKDGVYFDGSNTTNRILDVLEEKRPKIICIDEVDKMPRTFQNQLLNFMESGTIKVDQMRREYDFEIKGAKVFATCNEINRLSKPLQSRFRKLFLPKYTQQEFIDVSVKVLRKGKNLNDSLARYLGVTVFNQGGDIRDVLSIGKLIKKSDGPNDVDTIIQTLMKYGNEGGER